MLVFVETTEENKIYKDNKNAEVIVCPITCDGYKEHELYKELCELIPELDDFYDTQIKTGEIELGSNLYLKTQDECRIDILLTPVLKSIEDSCSPSTIELILDDIIEINKQLGKTSFAIPALGCVLGGLDFETQVKPIFESKFGEHEELDVEVFY